MPLLPTPIVLKVPGEVRFLRQVRVVARGIATACGLSSDESDDFRLVVDEVAGAMLGSGDGADITLRFHMDGDALAVEASTRSPEPRGPEVDRVSVSRQVLQLLTRAHRLVRDGSVLRFGVSTVFVPAPGH